MSFFRLQFFAVATLFLVSGGLGTMSFFSDWEGLTANVFGATELDQVVAGVPLEGLLCELDDRASTMLYTDNLGAIDFNYDLSAENISGALCDGLLAEVTGGGATLYDGPLNDLLVAGEQLAVGSSTELLLELRLMPGATSTGACNFDTVWTASQIGGASAPGFGDFETMSHSVAGSATGIGAGCVPPGPTVNLYLNKAISGGDHGFELSDFNYRITGEGIDTVVPHDSYTPLPEGMYTIEEIVPDGFVKEDWRIGWYGQCERGSDFVTTIEIEERHLDWGTLYCEADNQYRPQHGDNTESTDERTSVRESAGVESLTSSETEVTDETTTERESDRQRERTSSRGDEETTSVDNETSVVPDTTAEEALVTTEDDAEPQEEPTSEVTEDSTQEESLQSDGSEEGLVEPASEPTQEPEPAQESGSEPEQSGEVGTDAASE